MKYQTSPTWRLINDEHFQIMSLFKIGMRSLAEASNQQPGAYLAGLLSCALAIERLCKLVVIMDDLASKETTGKGNGVTRKSLRDDIRHDIWKGITAVAAIAQRRSIPASFPQRGSNWQSGLLNLLNDISDGKCRYHSIDTLVGEKADDPLVRLGTILNRLMQEQDLIHQNDLHRASAIGAAIGDITTTLMHDLDGSWLTTERALLLGSVYPRANRELRACLIDTMKPLADVAMSFDGQSPDFPGSLEHYYWFKNKTTYLSKLKTWK